MRDDYGGEDDRDDSAGKGDEGSDDGEDGEAEMEDVFARANENQEMDVVENLRRTADG